MFSGCKDAQTSADVSNLATFKLPADSGKGGAGGACTASLSSAIYENNHLTVSELIIKMRENLVKNDFEQIPQLSCSKKIPLDTEPFSLLAKNGGRAKRALFIGINYIGQQGELRGCHNDVAMIQKLVTTRLDFNPSETRVLMDDGKSIEPTAKNILEAFDWFTKGLVAGDSLFLHYSGHGGNCTDTSKDENDSTDETLVPLDYQRNGQITDDVIYSKLVLQIPKDCKLTVLMDCCHSGSIFDLPYIFVSDGSNNPVLTENPKFSWKKVFKVGMKLYQVHKSGGNLMAAAMAELKNDPSLAEGLSKEFAKYSGMKFEPPTSSSSTASPPQGKVTDLMSKLDMGKLSSLSGFGF